MPKRKMGEFDFTIWFDDGSRAQWKSRAAGTNADVAKAIRRYLVPFMERYIDPAELLTSESLPPPPPEGP